jgi:hypothetical protein
MLKQVATTAAGKPSSVSAVTPSTGSLQAAVGMITTTSEQMERHDRQDVPPGRNHVLLSRPSSRSSNSFHCSRSKKLPATLLSMRRYI